MFVGGWTGLREKAGPWLASGEAKLLVQHAVRPDPAFRDVPVIMDYAHDERQRQILRLAFTRPVLGPPPLSAGPRGPQQGPRRYRPD